MIVQNKDIEDMKKWMKQDFSSKAFVKLFGIRPTILQKKGSIMAKAIRSFASFVREYGAYVLFLEMNKVSSKVEEMMKLLFADILGELAISVKLTCDGYTSYALKNLRAALDLSITGLFLTTSWTVESKREGKGINPFGEAFLKSGLWGDLKALSYDELTQIIVEKVYLGREEAMPEERSIKSDIETISNSTLNSILRTFTHSVEEIEFTPTELSRIKTSIAKGISKAIVELFRKEANNKLTELIREMLFPDNFIELFKRDERLALASCSKDEEDMVADLKKRFGIYDKASCNSRNEDVDFLIFTTSSEGDDLEGQNVPICHYCDAPATSFALTSRPDTGCMLKLAKYQLSTERRKYLDECISKIFYGEESKRREFFGDLLYSNLYARLNNFVHHNIVEEPPLTMWYDEFFMPILKVNVCLLRRVLIDEKMVMP